MESEWNILRINEKFKWVKMINKFIRSVWDDKSIILIELFIRYFFKIFIRVINNLFDVIVLIFNLKLIIEILL